MIGNLKLTEQLADCEVGVPKQLTVLVTPTRNDVGAFEATVEELVDYEHEEPPAAEPPAVPAKGARAGAAPAVAAVMGRPA